MNGYIGALAVVTATTLLFGSAPSESYVMETVESKVDATAAATCGSCGGAPHSFCQGANPYDCDSSEIGCHCPTAQGSCGEWHMSGGCSSGLLESTEAIHRSLLANNLDAVRTIVAAQPRVVINNDRNAVQVVGCDKSIFAHIPLTQDQFKQLVDD
jgi:hypothetical protein